MGLSQINLDNKIKIIKKILELFLDIMNILKPIVTKNRYKEEIKKHGTLFKLAGLFGEISFLCTNLVYPNLSNEFFENLRD